MNLNRIVAASLLASSSILAQGTVNLDNHVVGSVVTHIYAGDCRIADGNAANDFPAGMAFDFSCGCVLASALR